MNIHTDLASSILIHPIFSEYTSSSYILSQRSVSGLDVRLSPWLKVKCCLTELQGWIRPEMKHCRRGWWLAGLLFVTPDLNHGWGWEGNSISFLLPPNQGTEGQAPKRHDATFSLDYPPGPMLEYSSYYPKKENLIGRKRFSLGIHTGWLEWITAFSSLPAVS